MKQIPPEHKFELPELTAVEIATIEMGLLQLKGKHMFDLLVKIKQSVMSQWTEQNKEEDKDGLL